ncbi:hypothetical protein EVAR_67991_1 [Eumeta japonica]|uniref:Uncharacterized protein n=1 Tax=Eumeta variegata TaxID=151549 RepID=A0A4C1ZQH7_EUMVA|nr:hypothetical protein EVAR_67991_1 [Eumeta japonica]
MKFLLLTLFLAAVNTAPLEDSQDPVEVIVNGVAEGEPLEIAHIVDIQLKEVVDGEVANTNDLLYPLTAQGIAEAAAAAEAEAVELEAIETKPELIETPVAEMPVVILPLPIELPEAPAAEVSLPESIALPEPAAPEVVEPSPVEQPSPEIVFPEPEAPEVLPPMETPVLPEPQPHPATGEVYNDGLVQVTINTPQDQGVVATLQSWVSMVINYFTGGVQTTQHVI